MRVTVLSGGPSVEREISLRSGAAVAEALREAGHAVYLADISPDEVVALDVPADVIFPVLHGAFGESGELQQILEARGVPFVGSGSAASRTGMDKVLTKIVWRNAGLPTPGWQVINTPEGGTMRSPCVVKAIDSGSSIDVYVCRTDAEAAEGRKAVLTRHPRAMIEHFVAGTELTIGIVDGRTLPPIRIRPPIGQFFDFQAKYAPTGGAEHCFDLGLPDHVVRRACDLSLAAHVAVGCRHLSRVDLMIDERQQPFLLEINTLPGFTRRSLLPEAAARGGTSMPALCDLLVRRAVEDASATANASVGRRRTSAR